MSEPTFKPGEIVYHKVNHLRMVLINQEDNRSFCKYLNADGNFELDWFESIEISTRPIPVPGFNSAVAIYSLPLKSSKE